MPSISRLAVFGPGNFGLGQIAWCVDRMPFPYFGLLCRIESCDQEYGQSTRKWVSSARHESHQYIELQASTLLQDPALRLRLRKDIAFAFVQFVKNAAPAILVALGGGRRMFIGAFFTAHFAFFVHTFFYEPNQHSQLIAIQFQKHGTPPLTSP